MTQEIAIERFLKELKMCKELGTGTVVLMGNQPLLDGTGRQFTDDDYLPDFGYDVITEV